MIAQQKICCIFRAIQKYLLVLSPCGGSTDGKQSLEAAMLRGFFVRGPQLSHLLALSNWLRAHTYHPRLIRKADAARTWQSEP